MRKRALRRLSHEHYPAYSTLYKQVLSETPGLTRYQARGRAWTRLRYQFPDRYLELFTLEQDGIRTDVPPDPRNTSWQRACGRLADLRDRNPGLFARLLAEEYQRWLAASGAGAPAGGRGPADDPERSVRAAVAAAPQGGTLASSALARGDEE